jgi:hypothetical protein
VPHEDSARYRALGGMTVIPRRTIGLALVALFAVGCGSSSPTKTVTVASTTTTAPPTTQTHRSPPSPPKPVPHRVHRSPKARSTAPPPGSDQSVEAVTSDGAVVILHDGSVYSVDSADQSTVSSWSSGDQVSVGESEENLFNVASGESVSATKVGDTSESNTHAVEGEHTQQTNSDDGSVLVLDDGSIWEVSPSDQATAATWTDAASITVNQGNAGPMYELVNTDEHESIQASYIGGE